MLARCFRCDKSAYAVRSQSTPELSWRVTIIHEDRTTCVAESTLFDWETFERPDNAFKALSQKYSDLVAAIREAEP